MSRGSAAFSAPPRGRFWIRFFPFALLISFLSMDLMGALGTEFQLAVVPPSVRTDEAPLPPPVRPSLSEGDYVQGVYHWELMRFHWSHLQTACEKGRALNEFQSRQCADYWSALQVGTVLAFLPFFMLILTSLWGRSTLTNVYQRAGEVFVPTRMIGRGVVTSPALAAIDFFGFLFCMKRIQVELSTGQQTQVYFEHLAITPSPGQTLLLYGPVQEFGKPRIYGSVYAPQVSIVPGIR